MPCEQSNENALTAIMQNFSKCEEFGVEFYFLILLFMSSMAYRS